MPSETGLNAADLALAFAASDAPDAQQGLSELVAAYGNRSADEADVVVALGGDGFLLQTLRDAMGKRRRVFGMNRGTVGFLMNDFAVADLPARILSAASETIRPLEMTAETIEGERTTALAINEVSLFRQSYQAAKISISVDNKLRMDELVCDGVMVATPAGSTAYNFSAQGPILPLDTPLLALTPVSPFRPRRWRGALLPRQSTVRFDVLEAPKRPLNAVADHDEVKSVVSVVVKQSAGNSVTLLFDPGRPWGERIISEQFGA